MDRMLRTFASDNNAPVAAEIMDALLQVNTGDAVGYGHDVVTERAIAKFREHFGAETDVYFAFNGTGANVAALSCLVRPFEAVVTPATAHLQTDECGAFERFTGCKILPVECPDGKLRVSDLEGLIGRTPDQHHVTPRAISISQATEFGGLYQPAEIRALCDFAHSHGVFVHVDGARISNAAVALGETPCSITKDLGVDVLTFGGTKNGLMFGEAILFFDPALHREAAPFARKQAMQLASKMRYVSAQFEALLTDARWQQYAAQANAMTRRLAERIARIPQITITRPVECNAIFATLDRTLIAAIQERYYFYVFDEALPEVRWMTHFATQESDVDRFADCVETIVRT
ncbi:MAG: aminotransferase class V-fold PLP-dependent enzyme [Candidatus Eremiobacteraeota bacterium]|nr:aminotransferase class V-fold PLP-dependent enzyme [Candidatus Eremiobacteraeota bacterium]